jgi:AcrR family transcriptional regulator
MDAVHDLLQSQSVRDLTIEAVAARARVGKPTIYKWWPTKADLVMAMFAERLDTPPPPNGAPAAGQPAREAVRVRVQLLMTQFNGLFGRVLADLVAEDRTTPPCSTPSINGTSAFDGPRPSPSSNTRVRPASYLQASTQNF